MSDRELLEAAAKAAGMVVVPYTWHKGTGWDHEGFTVAGAGPNEWNPLEDDGDALRLAVKLRIKFRYNEALGQALAWIGGASEMEDQRANIEDHGRDECATARRAITMAAAEIGRKS